MDRLAKSVAAIEYTPKPASANRILKKVGKFHAEKDTPHENLAKATASSVGSPSPKNSADRWRIPFRESLLMPVGIGERNGTGSVQQSHLVWA